MPTLTANFFVRFKKECINQVPEGFRKERLDEYNFPVFAIDIDEEGQTRLYLADHNDNWVWVKDNLTMRARPKSDNNKRPDHRSNGYRGFSPSRSNNSAAFRSARPAQQS